MSVRSAKSFWTCCARASLVVVVLLALALAAGQVDAKRKKKKPRDPEELFNPLVGIEYSHWLVGSISLIAEDQEIDEYLLTASDEEAQSFIDDFWERRAEGVGLLEKTPRQIFDERAVEADKRFTEAAYPGRRTDRGSIFIVFGEPESIEFPTPQKLDDPTLEVWNYRKNSAGLGAQESKKSYRFIKIDDITVLYTGQQLGVEHKLKLKRRRF